MTQPTNTFDRYDLSTNVREQLSDIITNISPTETPLLSNIGRQSATNNYVEWLGDTLASATANARIDGDTFAGTALSPALRFGNYCQIAWKVLVVSRRAEKVNKAGRKSEMAMQLAKAGKSLKLDKEYCLVAGLGGQASAVGNSTSAPTTANITSWIKTNASRGTGGSAPAWSGSTYGTPTTAATDAASSNLRAISEATLLSLVASTYTAGGSPSMLMCSPAAKQKITGYLFSSTAARVATQYQDQGKGPRGGATVLGAIDTWVTDFGALDIVVNRNQRDRDVFILDPETWAVAYIDDMATSPLAKTADSEQTAIVSDYALVSLAEKANAVFADAKVATAMTG